MYVTDFKWKKQMKVSDLVGQYGKVGYQSVQLARLAKLAKVQSCKDCNLQGEQRCKA